MKRRFLIPVAALAALLTMSAIPVEGAGPHSSSDPSALPPHQRVVTTWHRFNPAYTANVNNEHERLRCVRSVQRMTCLYDKVKEPDRPRFRWNATTGIFTGHRKPMREWTCPVLLPLEACSNARAVYAGKGTFFPFDGEAFEVRQQYILTTIGGYRTLYVRWVGQFACPWFGSFERALAQNPTRHFDCAEPV